MFLTLLAFAFAIGLLVVIHELGHYWVARYCGVHVERFSFGFGKVLAKYTDRRGCEWAFSAIPLGGYVMMRNQAPETASEDYKSSTVQSKTVWQRIAITAAGPIANLVLAAFLYAILAWMGTPEPVAILAEPATNTPAAEAGFKAQDKILAVEDKPLSTWSSFRWAMLDRVHTDKPVEITVSDLGGHHTTRVLNNPHVNFADSQEIDPLEELGFAMLMPKPSIQQVIAGGAAERAGLLKGDEIVSINGQFIDGVHDFLNWVRAHPDTAATFEVIRNGRAQSFPVHVDAVQEQGEQIGRVGAMIGAQPEIEHTRAGLWKGLTTGVERTANTFWFSVKMLGRMVTGQISVKTISGPVTIADYAGQTARVGLGAYIQFLALISVSIGLLNLLPIPMLDGGHLLYYAIEAVRGKPLPDKWQDIGHRIGLSLLAALMVLAFVNDFTRVLQ
ncbi:MAG TPA: RIP metalloprotease RseP [Paenalcaligenes sp.]|nr:RIP metalloprotease RseP [Paenalcaligenes sp.]